MRTEERKFRVDVQRHQATGLFVAISPDHKGLNVFAHSEEALKKLIPDALRALLVAEGKDVVSVTAEHESGDFEGFVHPGFIAAAQLQAAA